MSEKPFAWGCPCGIMFPASPAGKLAADKHLEGKPDYRKTPSGHMIYPVPFTRINSAIRCAKCGEWIPAKSLQYQDWLSCINLFDDGVREDFYHTGCAKQVPRVAIRYGE